MLAKIQNIFHLTLTVIYLHQYDQQGETQISPYAVRHIKGKMHASLDKENYSIYAIRQGIEIASLLLFCI